MNSITHNEFEKRLLNKNTYYKNREFKLVGEISSLADFIIVENELGLFKMRPPSLLRNSYPSIRTAIDKTAYYKKLVEPLHPNLDFSETQYTNAKTRVKYRCPQHGYKYTSPANLLKGCGCRNCSTTGGRKNGKYYAKKLEKIFKGDNYTFINLNDNITTKIKCKCEKHGVFKKQLRKLLEGKGCQKCSADKMSKLNAENSTGWNYSSWIKAAEKSKNFDSYKVYIIKCWNDEEEFYKIGRTFKTVNDRFRNNLMMPYKFTISKIIESEDAEYICELENKLKLKNKINKYTPKIEFGGMYECFSEIK